MSQFVNKKDAIYQLLKERIVAGDYQPESRLPREVEFAKQLGVGRVTLRSALDRLLEEGLVQRLPGKGTFISASSEICPRRYLAILPPQNESFESPMSHIMPGIEQQAALRSVKIQKYSVDFFKSIEINEGVARINEGRYDGVFFMVNGVIGDERDFHIVKASGLPVIMPHATQLDHEITGFATMRTNEKEAFSTAIEFLKQKGHKVIGTVFLSRLEKCYARGFEQGEYDEFLNETGFDVSPGLTHYCRGYCYEDIAEAVKSLLFIAPPLTAIMCHSDFVALHVYRALRKMKVRIPEEVAIMGYCGYPGGELLSPPLSTVDLFFEDIGRDALTLMLESDKWWKPGVEPPLIYTPYEVIERGSTNIRRT